MKPGRLKADFATVEDCARNLVDEHEFWCRAGFNLTRQSALYVNAKGEVTARFVYRRATASLTFTLKKLPIAWA